MSVGFVYLGVVVGLLVMENSLVYPGSKYPAGNWEPDFSFEEIEFNAEDGVNIHAWLLPDPVEREDPRYFLLCHGNAENVSQAGGFVGQALVHACGGTVMVFDYRGFGKSEGSSHEAGIKLDAAKAMDVFCEKMNIQPQDVILVGHSLGGAVASWLASTKGCKALVLQRTFNNLPDVAQSKYPWAPVKFLMSNRWNSEEALANLNVPTFQSHGNLDRIVPLEFGQKLSQNLSHPLSQFVVLNDFGHNDGFPSSYWTQLQQWLDRVDAQIVDVKAMEPEPSDGQNAKNR